MRANKCTEILTIYLNQYRISLQMDIVAIETDGSNIMIKSRKNNIEHHLCFTHGTHLTISDVLYNKYCIQQEFFFNLMTASHYETEYFLLY